MVLAVVAADAGRVRGETGRAEPVLTFSKPCQAIFRHRFDVAGPQDRPVKVKKMRHPEKKRMAERAEVADGRRGGGAYDEGCRGKRARGSGGVSLPPDRTGPGSGGGGGVVEGR